MYNAIPKEIRDQVLSHIKNDGISVTDTAINGTCQYLYVDRWSVKIKII